MAATVNLEDCIGCGKCVEVCPVEAIRIEHDRAVVNDDLCVECNACIEECKHEALSL